ncbi:hypothetical protein C2S53_006299 [Perilla frutescens var. hirtella]|uniref:Uncharacterized protein n=1 Tax=Perilla frutescens var. hirtella TaxID=608512 RepID=A0AAD4IXE3_PERFH|nr:hypothetical protein C2S53_006299 [Perilla frutescens var. hirtella]
MAAVSLHSSCSPRLSEVAPILNTCTVQQPRAALSRLHILLHFAAVSALLHYRLSNLINGSVPLLSWGLITLSELIFAFIWILAQAFRWRPVVRTVAPENLPADEKLPGVDVFVCTADRKKEPVVEVMNTVLSAMGMDYPPEKLAVYLSDDGGAAVTLYALKEACVFAQSWLPFCRNYGIQTRCPEAFFSSFGEAERGVLKSDEFKVEEERMESKYEVFKRNVEKAAEMEDSVNDDRPPHVEPIHVLVTNSILAKQAMCFHLDPQLSDSLSFAQFPQIFYNVSKNDIYDGQTRSAYKTKYQGMDGQGGTICAGTGYYIKKKALFCSRYREDEYLREPEKNFGSSEKLIDSVQALNINYVKEYETISDSTVVEANKLASCTYEHDTKWGKEIGYSYDCLLESSFTGYLMHCKGWKSVYLYPDRPCFLGCTTINMKDAVVQQMKWASGWVQIGLSRFSPLAYGLSRMPLLQSLCYGYFIFIHLISVACLLYGIVPPLCFFYEIPLYPKVTSPWFAAFAAVYASSVLQHLYEVVLSGGSMRTMWNEQRMWFIRGVTACLFGCLDVLMKYAGMAKANFRLTNKVVDQEKLEKYEKGKFDFQGAKMFMIPLTMLVLLNLGCFIGGVKGLIAGGNTAEMFGQGLLSLYVLVLSLPILEGLVPKIGK